MKPQHYMATQRTTHQHRDRTPQPEGEGDTDAATAPTIEDLLAEKHSEELTHDEIFEILSNTRRRFTINYLQDTNEPVDIRELSAAIAAEENDKSIDALSSQERKRVYVALYQCHLPKMDTMNIVAFDKSRGIIEPEANIQVLTDYLAALKPSLAADGGTTDERMTPDRATPWVTTGANTALVLGVTTIAGMTLTYVAVLAILVAVTTWVGVSISRPRRASS